jgi:hypothetical protein
MYTIAYIDEDKGWQQTFYDYFKDDFKVIIIEISKGTSIEYLVNEIQRNEIQMLVLDFRLNETGEVNFNGDAVIETILSKRPHFPILVLTSFEPDAISTLDNVHIINGKDILDGESQEKVDLLKLRINSAINNYYTKIGKAEDRIKFLITKRNNENLEPKEEEDLAKNYIFLDEINPDDKSLPANLILPASISKLNDFVSQTKAILDQLKNKS